MELSINRQAYALISSVLTGIGIGALYDLMRMLRIRLKRTALFDALFWLVSLFALFRLGMSAGGGQLHIFMAVFALLGFWGYMRLMSRGVYGVFNMLAGGLELILSPLAELIKKARHFVRNRVEKQRSRRTMRKSSREGEKVNVEISENVSDSIGGAHRVCCYEPRGGTAGRERGRGADEGLREPADSGKGRKRKAHKSDRVSRQR